MSLLHSPLRSVLRSPLHGPSVGRWDAPLLYPVGNRNGLLTAQASAQTVGSSLHHKNGGFVLKNIVALYQNCYMTTTGVITANAFPITVTGSMEIGGTKRQFTWGGASSVVIPGTIFGRWTDPLPYSIAANADCIAHTWADAGPGGTYLRGLSGKLALDGYEQGAAITDKTMTTGYANTGFFATYGPSIVAGELSDGDRSARVVIGIGDSLKYGGAGAFTNVEYDPAGGDAFGNFGWWNRKLGGTGLGFINLGRQSLKSQDINAADWSIVFAMIAPFMRDVTHFHYGIGKNDLASRTANQLADTEIAGNIAKVRAFKNVGKHFVETIPPGTTSSDSWATTGNQTVQATESVRTGVNDKARAGTIVGQDGFIDVALACETSLNSGIWKATPTAWCGDSTGHPTIVGAAGVAAAMTLPS